MPFPRKFKQLLEIELTDVEHPDYLVLTYVVCACDPDACGWGGWTLEAAFREDSTAERGARALPSDSSQRCPRCGKVTFRTLVSVEYTPSEDQTRIEIGTDNVAELDYED
jgi:hypothetical protein